MMRQGSVAVLFAVLLGAGACDPLEPASGDVFDSPAARDAGVEPDLSVKWEPPPGKQAGQIILTAKSMPLGKIAAGGRYQLLFLVDTLTSYDDVYRFTLSAIDVTGASIDDWNRGSAVVPTVAKVELYKPQMIRATFTVPAGAQVARLVLRAESAGGIQGNAFPLLIKVGEVAEISDPRVTPKIQDQWALDKKLWKEEVAIDGIKVTGFRVAFGGKGVAMTNQLVDATAPGAAGAFRFTAEIEGTPGDWSAALLPDHFDNIPAGRALRVDVQLANQSTTANPAVSYLMVRAEHLPSPGAPVPDYISWLRVPIRGYMP